MKNTAFHEQIAKYYQKKLASYEVIEVGDTPEYLLQLGVEKLPVIMKQSVLSKVIRQPKGSRSAHSMSRDEIEQIPTILRSPAVLVKRENERLALISELPDSKGDPMLLAMELNQKLHGMEVNSITSFYGREKCKNYLESQENVMIIDIKRAKELSRLLGLQLPMAWKILDCASSIIPYEENVKRQKCEILPRQRDEIAADIKKSGFYVTESLIEKIGKLDGITGKANTMRDICDTYKAGCTGLEPEAKETVEKIAGECKTQEMTQIAIPEPEL